MKDDIRPTCIHCGKQIGYKLIGRKVCPECAIRQFVEAYFDDEECDNNEAQLELGEFKSEMFFNGDIIIGDLFRWTFDHALLDRVNQFAMTDMNHLQHFTWDKYFGQTFYDIITGNPVGKILVRTGNIGVYNLSEVLKDFPEFKDISNDHFVYTIIKNFKGIVRMKTKHIDEYYGQVYIDVNGVDKTTNEPIVLTNREVEQLFIPQEHVVSNYEYVDCTPFKI